MKNHDLLDAIGDVSEQTVQKYALPRTKEIEHIFSSDDAYEAPPIRQTKKKPFRIHMGTVAAAVALCLGLNAAIFYGVHKMKQDAAGAPSGSETSTGSQIAPVSAEPDKPYFTVTEASSTEIYVKLRNPTDEDFSFNPEFAILDGEQIIPVNNSSGQLKSPFIPKQTNYEGFSYEFLDDGIYKFVNLNKDGSVSDSFEPVEFRIPTTLEYYDEHDQPYLEVIGANETAVTVKLKNPTDKEFTYNSEFAVMNGNKKIRVNRASPYDLDTPLAPHQRVYVVFAYQRQKPGTYKFVNLNKDSTVSDSFEPVEFEISAEQANNMRMPGLVGVRYEDALVLYGNGIQIVSDSWEYSEYEEGIIIEQDIPEDGPISAGETVHVKVSRGGKRVLMPDVTDWEFETAKSTIAGLGLLIDKRSAYDPEVAEGKVISTDPQGPIEVELGSYIRVTVSLGKNKDTIPVPNFLNMNWENAKEVAKSLNLNVMMKEVDDEAEEGTVLNQNVQPNEEVSEGSQIELTVSNGKKREQPVHISFTIPANAAGKYHIGLYEGGVAKAVGGQFDPQYAAGVTSLVIEGNETTDVVAVLVNDDNGKEATLGMYTIHFDTQSYDTLSENIAEAFEKVQ